MTRPPVLASTAIGILAVPLFAACHDGTAPETSATHPPESLVTAEMSVPVDPRAPVIDAAERLALAVEEATLRGELQTQLRDLAAAWSTGRTRLAGQRIESARRLTKLLAEKGLASAADLDAIELALDEAERGIAAPDRK